MSAVHPHRPAFLLDLLRAPTPRRCPGCGQVTHLYVDAETPAGACFTCKVDTELVGQRDSAMDAETPASVCGVD